MNENGISIIIINYYSEFYIESLVSAIVSSIKNKYELIVINNSPQCFNWSSEYIAKNNIVIVNSEKNDGFGIGANKGVLQSKYNYICIANPDIKLFDFTIDRLFSNLVNSSSDVGACSCLSESDNGDLQENFFMNNSLDKKNFTYFCLKNLCPLFIKRLFDKSTSGICKIESDDNKYLEVGGFYCSFVMFKKNAYQDIGGFDPDFFMYAEDVDFFRNRFSKKYRSILYKFVGMNHFCGKTDKYGLMSKQSQVSYLLYLRKTGNYYLFVYILTLSIKYILLYIYSIFREERKNYKKEIENFFESIKYLNIIMKYPSGYGKQPSCLKIKEIKD